MVNTYSINKRDKFNKKGILIYGHHHTPYIEKIDDIIYICVGSILLPRNNSKPSYAIYENKKIAIYSIEKKLIDNIDID